MYEGMRHALYDSRAKKVLANAEFKNFGNRSGEFCVCGHPFMTSAPRMGEGVMEKQMK